MALVEVVVAVTKKTKNANSLAALTIATLALPGISPTAIAAEAEYFDLDSQFTRYSESNNRMKIDVYQANASIPFNDKFKLKINGVKDVITGASPIYYKPTNGQAKMQKSGASIKDVRDAVDISGNYIHSAGNVGLNVGRSSENDYDSTFFNIDSLLDFNQKRTSLSSGYGYSSDNVWAVDHCPSDYIYKGSQCASIPILTFPPGLIPQTFINNGMYRRPDVGGEKQTHQGLLGLTQILNKDALIQTNLTYTHNQGYLSDPYKDAYLEGATPLCFHNDCGTYVHDTRPTNRDQFATLVRYVQHFGALNAAAMHVDYRFYADTWGVDAHTFEFTWIQPIYAGWNLTPRMRYYSQGAADFYAPYFLSTRADGFYSSDYRLANFGAIGGGVQLNKEFFNRLNLGLGIDFYERKMNYGINGGAGTAEDNFSFSMFSAKINFKY